MALKTPKKSGFLREKNKFLIDRPEARFLAHHAVFQVRPEKICARMNYGPLRNLEFLLVLFLNQTFGVSPNIWDPSRPKVMTRKAFMSEYL